MTQDAGGSTMFGMTYPDSIPIVPQYDGPAPGRCGPGAPPGCGQHPAEPQLYERTSGGGRTPVAFTGLGVSPRAFHMPWVRGDWGPSWAWTWMPGGAPVEGADPGFRGLGAVSQQQLIALSSFARSLPYLHSGSPQDYAGRGLYRLAILQGFAGADVTGAVFEAWKALRDTHGSGSVAKVTSVVSAILGIVSAISGLPADARSVLSDIGSNGAAVMQELATYYGPGCTPNGPCSDASKCPSGTVWLATRSVPEGGMCVDPESYRQMVRAATPTGLPTTSAKKNSAPVIIGVSVAALAVGVLVYALA